MTETLQGMLNDIDSAAYAAIGVGVVAGLAAIIGFAKMVKTRKAKVQGEQEMAKIQRRLYAFEEIRRITGRVLKNSVEDLVKKGQLDRHVADLIEQELAFKLGNWELHPKPKPCSAPDPDMLKAVIRTRLSGARVVVRLPDVQKVHRNSLDDLLFKI